MAILRFRLTNGYAGTIITHVIDNIRYCRGEEMPAVKKVPREEIVDAAVEVLREGGAAALNARSAASDAPCSP